MNRMGYIKLFFDKDVSKGETPTIEDVRQFIAEKHEESLYIEYKKFLKTEMLTMINQLNTFLHF